MRSLLRRAALDIGSGSIKFQISDIDPYTQRIIKNILIDQKQVLFMNDALKNNQFLSDEIQLKGEQNIKNFIYVARQHKCHEIHAVATQAFRTAKNGLIYLENLKNQYQFQYNILDQQEEAILGFENAKALSNHNPQQMIVWDCGAGSFQMSGLDEDQILHTYIGKYGSGTALDSLLKIQNKQNNSPNPVNTEQFQNLCEQIYSNTPSKPLWMGNKIQVIGIGSQLSIFNQAEVLLRKQQYGVQDVKTLIERCLNLSDENISIFEKQQCIEQQYDVVKENARYIIPKLSVLYALMKKLEFQSLQNIRVNGLCSAVLVHQQFWNK